MYIGRFAPSPTGALHLGSLMTAIASYCEAMKHNGQWIVRLEDLDPPREILGASIRIINTLKKLDFKFDPSILFQSQRHEAYNQAINRLENLSAIYYCSCSRTELKNVKVNDHTCRKILKKPSLPYSIKLKVTDENISFFDAIQGKYAKNLLNDCGDFVIKRKDELFSYQLAVVVDDDFQKINHIVRGIDLIDSTPWQIYLNLALNYNQPTYAHIPILVNTQGQKLSKQTFAQEIDNENPLKVLMQAYNYLNQTQFVKTPKTITGFWQHAIKHWDINKISKTNAIQV